MCRDFEHRILDIVFRVVLLLLILFFSLLKELFLLKLHNTGNYLNLFSSKRSLLNFSTYDSEIVGEFIV